MTSEVPITDNAINQIKPNEKKENLKTKIKKRNLENEIESEKKKLPEKVRKEIEREEDRKKRLDIQDTKKSLWKLRHKEKKYETKSRKLEILEEIDNLEEKLTEINRIVEKIRIDEEKIEKERKERTEQIKKEKEKRKAEKLRKESLKKERIEKAKVLGKRWEMLRWLTNFLKENKEKWEVEKKEREEENRKILDDWERAKRFEKIRKLKERWDRKDHEKDKPLPAENPCQKETWEVWRKKPLPEKPSESTENPPNPSTSSPKMPRPDFTLTPPPPPPDKVGKQGGKPTLVQSKIKFPVEKKNQLQAPSDGLTGPTEKKSTEKKMKSKENQVDEKITVTSKLEDVPKVPSERRKEEPKLEDRDETTTIGKPEHQSIEKNIQKVSKEKK